MIRWYGSAVPRRIELADVADGLTGHVLWSVRARRFPVDETLGLTYEFNLVAGTSTPEASSLRILARDYRDDFARHLHVLSIEDAWVGSASLSLGFDVPTAGRESLVTCRVTITDDLGRVHTSTRRGRVHLPGRWRSRMSTRRFNWIILLVGGIALVGVGVAGVIAEAGANTVPWFALGAGLLAGAIVLRRMRLP